MIRRNRGRSSPAMAMAASLVVVSATPAGAAGSTVLVTSGADSGEGTFRAAVQAANNDPAIALIRFAEDLEVSLETPVEYTGEQALKLNGKSAIVDGSAGDPSVHTGPDAGLFVSHSAAALDIRNISFDDSLATGCPREANSGDFDVLVVDSTITGNDSDGINAAQEDDGSGHLEIQSSTLLPNGGVAVDADADEVTVVGAP